MTAINPPDPRPPSRSWRRIHAGAPLASTYVKLPSSARCSDCDWGEDATEVTAPAMQALRRNARDHAATAHHRVTVHLAQDVILEPKHPRTREKALEAAP